jgi:uncharacterized membrane protein (UPF0127 family)
MMQTSNKHSLENIAIAYIRAGNVYINAQIVTGLFTKLKGLLFQSKLGDRQALVLTPCAMVHTFGMDYDIDIIFLDKNFRVVKIIHTCSPWRLVYCKNSTHALKMLGGQAEDLHLSVGQTFVFYPASV